MATAGTHPGPGAAAGGGRRWRGNHGLSLAVRAVAYLAPILVGTAAAVSFSRVVPAPPPSGWLVAWVAAVVGFTTGVVAVVELLARRLLPLAVLLDMTLVFPDQAPSRFAIARRRGGTRELRARLAEAARGTLPAPEGERAQLILELVLALSAHDRRTRGHSERVRVFAEMLGEEMRLTPDERDRLRWSSLLHDIGKLAVPSEILNKPGRPEADEWATLQRHPVEGARIVGQMMPYFGADLGGAVEHHHEKFDGSGYPHGLSGEAISLGGRMVAVADSFEVMTAARPYKKPMTAEAARDELVRCAGTHFDPAVVRAFLNISIGRLRRSIGLAAAFAQLPLVGRVPGLLSELGTPATAAATSLAVVGVLGATGGLAGINVASAMQCDSHLAAATGAPNAAADPTTPLVVGRLQLQPHLGAVAVDGQAGRLFVGNANTGEVRAFSTRGLAPVGVPIQVGAQPLAAALDPVTGRLFVANYGSCSISVIDARAPVPTLVANVRVDSRPGRLAVDVASGRVFVVNGGRGGVSVIDGRADPPVVLGGRVPAGPPLAPENTGAAVAVDQGSGRVWVTYPGGLAEIDGRAVAPRLVARLAGPNTPIGVAVDQASGRVFVAANGLADSLAVYDGRAQPAALVTGAVPTQRNPVEVAIDPVTRHVFVACYGAPVGTSPPGGVTIIDSRSLAVVANLVGVANALLLAVDPTTGTVYVTERNSGRVLALRG